MQKAHSFLKLFLVISPIIVGIFGFMAGAVWRAAAADTAFQITQVHHNNQIARLNTRARDMETSMQLIQIKLQILQDDMDQIKQKLNITDPNNQHQP